MKDPFREEHEATYKAWLEHIESPAVVSAMKSPDDARGIFSGFMVNGKPFFTEEEVELSVRAIHGIWFMTEPHEGLPISSPRDLLDSEGARAISNRYPLELEEEDKNRPIRAIFFRRIG